MPFSHIKNICFLKNSSGFESRLLLKALYFIINFRKFIILVINIISCPEKIYKITSTQVFLNFGFY